MPSSRLQRFFRELRRRRVVQVVVAYAVAGWVVIEVTDVVAQPLGLPAWTLTLVIVLVALGAPIALVLAWVFDITPHGVEATQGLDEEKATGGPESKGASAGHLPLERALSEADDELAPGTTVGHYVVVERIGQRGASVVYRARDRRLDRPVALEVPPSQVAADPETARRLLIEARAVARVDHPNICTIHEIGSLEDGRIFVAMPLYEGRTVARALEAGELGADEAVGIGTQVARGLHRAHGAGLVHGRIEPTNLFLTDDGVVKILDLGIARVLTGAAGHAAAGNDEAGRDDAGGGEAPGTAESVAYASPERLRGEEFGPGADLWGLGVVLYEICAGAHPFAGEDAATLRRRILEEAPTPLAEAVPAIDEELAALVGRCLEKEPGARPADARAVIADLERLAARAAASPRDADPATAERDAGSGRRSGSADAHPAPALAPEGERRPATILVAECAGLEALEDVLSPRESDALLEACCRVAESVIAAHHGVVNLNRRGKLQALFGIPAVHEDDALRAVRAARAICARSGELLASATDRPAVGIRCGLDSGRVVARPGESDESRYRVAGPAAERSGRLAARARAGEILVSEECRRLVEPFFDLEEAPDLPAHGDQRPTRVWRVTGETGARSRLEATGGRGLTRLVSREDELEALLAATESARDGDGGFVSIVGEAGMGKSRLLHELVRRLGADRFLVARGRCQSFGGDIPYHPFIEVLRDRLDLEEGGEEESPALLAERVRRIAPELAEFTPFYVQLLALGGEERPPEEAGAGEQVRVGLVESIVALLTLGAQREPTVLLLEDWHWADAASRQVLRQMLEMVSAYPLLVVVTSRPEGELDWPTTAAATPIVLGALSSADSVSIVASVLGAEDVPLDLARLLHDRTGGNPFFLEELCYALREDGTLAVEDGRVILRGRADDLELPDTVQGVLRARLDRLDASTRRLAAVASVVGREFGRDVLERALPEEVDIEAGLERLRSLGLIQPLRLVPVPVYRFKHALMQEAVYDGLLEWQRSEVHGAVGEALEALHPARPDEHADRMAEHFARAGRWEKALEYAIAAADHLRSFGENREAAEVLGRALERVAHLPDDERRLELRVRLLLRQERVFEFLGRREEQAETIDELLGMLEGERHPRLLAATYVRQGDLRSVTGDHAGAERALERALRLAREQEATAIECQALRSMGLLRWYQQRHEEAIALVERTIELDRELENEEGLIGDLANLGSLYKTLGEHDRALELFQEALERDRRAQRESYPAIVKESYILHRIATVHSALGDRARALEYLEMAKAAARPGDIAQAHYHLTGIARHHLEEGRIEQSLDAYREAVELGRKTDNVAALATSLRLLGDVLHNLDRHREALPHLEEAAELFARLQDEPSEMAVRHDMAKSYEALGQRRRALEAWRATGELARDLEERDVELESLEGAARALRAEDPTAAADAYRRAIELAGRAGDPDRRGRLRYALGILHWESGAHEAGLESLEAGLGDLEEAGNPVDAGLVLNSIGRTLRDLGRLDEAQERLEAAIEMNRETGERLLEAHALATLGDVHLDRGDPDAAAPRFEEALRIREELEDPAGRGWMLVRLARVQAARGKPAGVSYYLEEAEEIASGLGDRDLVAGCEELRRSSRLVEERER